MAQAPEQAKTNNGAVVTFYWRGRFTYRARSLIGRRKAEGGRWRARGGHDGAGERRQLSRPANELPSLASAAADRKLVQPL